MWITRLRRAGSGILFGVLILVAAFGFAAAPFGVIVGGASVVVFVAAGYFSIRLAK